MAGGIFVHFLGRETMRKRKQYYTVTKDADMLAPKWLAARINYTTVKFLYHSIDGHATLKGVRIGDATAQIGDRVVFEVERISVERR